MREKQLQDEVETLRELAAKLLIEIENIKEENVRLRMRVANFVPATPELAPLHSENF